MNGLSRFLMSLALGAIAILGFFFLTTVGVIVAIVIVILLIIGGLSLRWRGGSVGSSHVILFRRIGGKTVITRAGTVEQVSPDEPVRPMDPDSQGPCVELPPEDYRKVDDGGGPPKA